jgi:hypothetical protein
MLILGSVYFGKLLEVCNLSSLESYAAELRPILTEATGTELGLIQSADPDKVERWSKGVFNEPAERTMRFPRVMYVFRPVSGAANEQWRITVFVTPIPNIRCSYGNRRTKHSIPDSVERKLGTRLVESQLADTFDLKTEEKLAGTPAGIYLHLKLRSISRLRERLESGKYAPPGSELRELLKVLPSILTARGGSSPLAVEIANRRAPRRDFLASCDQRIVASLGKEKLQGILEPSRVSVEKWLSAGKRRLW